MAASSAYPLKFAEAVVDRHQKFVVTTLAIYNDASNAAIS